MNELDNATGEAVNVDPLVSHLRPSFEAMLHIIAEQMTDVSYWRIAGFVKDPKGDRQPSDSKYFDHEFVDQQCWDDDCSGCVYLPVGDDYLKVEYHG